MIYLFDKSASPGATLAMESASYPDDVNLLMLEFLEEADTVHQQYDTLSEFADNQVELHSLHDLVGQDIEDNGAPSSSALESYARNLRRIEASFGYPPNIRPSYSQESIALSKEDRDSRLAIARVTMQSAIETGKDVIHKLIEWFKTAYENAMRLFTKGASAYEGLRKEINAAYAGKNAGGFESAKAASLKLVGAGRAYSDKTKAAIDKLKARMSGFRVGEMNEDDRFAYSSIAGVLRDVMGVYRKKSSKVFQLCKAGIRDVRKDVTTNADLDDQMTKLATHLDKLAGIDKVVATFTASKTRDAMDSAKDAIDSLLRSED